MSAHHPSFRRDDQSAGFVLVPVLWVFAALAALASIYAVYVANTASSFVVQGERMQVDGLVRAAVELAAYQLMTPARDRPTDGTFNFRLGSADVAADFRSEAARIDINSASKELLSGLFGALGARRNEANDYADRIIEWRTPASPAPAAGPPAYGDAGARDLPRRDRFPAIGELFMVRGLPPALVERALPFLTVYSGRPQVNVLEAAPEVISALPGMTQDRLRVLLAERRVSRNPALLKLLGPAEAYATVEGGKTFRVNAGVTFDDGVKATVDVVIVLFDSGPEPFAILSWQDVQDSANTN